MNIFLAKPITIVYNKGVWCIKKRAGTPNKKFKKERENF